MIGDEAAAREWLKTLPEFDALAERRTERLISLLSEENRRQNLISAASLETIWRRHVADSAQLLTYVSGDAAPWLDLGTGGGFPGLVLAILRPEMRILLVESRPQRADWLRRAFAELDLPSVEVHGEPLSRIPTEPVRVISARAFAPLDRLVALSARFSTSDTIWLLPKG
ncbi:MAG: 16S rRNA (guanine(527)-N(7))-methyltransferase RsmG, partial [Novosphingobium sp.]|nr:16S rRNA (guanine(527)-N(7))-methyltransferase RsmG [Novosphingobium sp.]